MIMKVKIDFTKSAQENADIFYKRSKKLAQKRLGAEQAIKELERKLAALKAKEASEADERRAIVKRQMEWYEKFHWSTTSSGLLVVGGRDAHQNELLNSRHFGDTDLFFHASIFGASVMILKGGAAAPHEVREEVAQLAASYSSAWKDGLRTVDVYAMRRDQVSKSMSKGSLSTGSFLLSGERDWYRNTGLGLVFFMEGPRLSVSSELTFQKLEAKHAPYITVKQGASKKSDAAKFISKVIGFNDLDTIMQQLPAGTFSLKPSKQQKTS